MRVTILAALLVFAASPAFAAQVCHTRAGKAGTQQNAAMGCTTSDLKAGGKIEGTIILLNAADPTGIPFEAALSAGFEICG